MLLFIMVVSSVVVLSVLLVGECGGGVCGVVVNVAGWFIVSVTDGVYDVDVGIGGVGGGDGVGGVVVVVDEYDDGTGGGGGKGGRNVVGIVVVAWNVVYCVVVGADVVVDGC